VALADPEDRIGPGGLPAVASWSRPAGADSPARPPTNLHHSGRWSARPSSSWPSASSRTSSTGDWPIPSPRRTAPVPSDRRAAGRRAGTEPRSSPWTSPGSPPGLDLALDPGLPGTGAASPGRDGPHRGGERAPPAPGGGAGLLSDIASLLGRPDRPGPRRTRGEEPRGGRGPAPPGRRASSRWAPAPFSRWPRPRPVAAQADRDHLEAIFRYHDDARPPRGAHRSPPAEVDDRDADFAGVARPLRRRGRLRRSTSSSARGLDPETSAERLATRPNVLPEEAPEHPFLRFLKQFRNVLIYVLLAAAVLTAFLGEWLDTGVILLVVLVERRGRVRPGGKGGPGPGRDSEPPLADCPVLRPRREDAMELDAADLVPGDVVKPRERGPGAGGPADREALRARVEEALLTGESEPVGKSTDPVAEDALPRTAAPWRSPAPS
jgi:hypothetical protein